MDHSKMIALLLKVHQQTLEGRLAWEETEFPEVFQVAFTTNTVRIGIASSKGRGADLYYLSIYNAAGSRLETAFHHELSDEMPDSYDVMKQIHELARRKAMGVDQAIDKLLAELDKEKDDL